MMTDFTWLAPQWLWLLITPLLWLIISYYQYKRSHAELEKFSQAAITKRWQKWPALLMVITLTSLVLALARPAWDPQPEGVSGQGRDIIFLLDVSRSMLAADSRPNRLEVARNAMMQTVNASSTDRYGLVAFAGAASILSPLTNDKAFFKNLLTNVNTDSVPQGGTRIEDALFKVIDKMINKDSEAAAVDLILISDGEDLGSQPQRALDNLNALGVRLIVIGLGDSQFGARIPKRPANKTSQHKANNIISKQSNGWVFHQERELWSKMNTQGLRELSKGATQGMFFAVGTASFDLGKIITKLRQVWPGESHHQSENLQYKEAYPYCLLLAVFALFLLLIRTKAAMFAGLVLLSLNSQAQQISASELALTESAKAESIKAESTVAESSSSAVITQSQREPQNKSLQTEQQPTEQPLSTLTLAQKFALAESLMAETPEQAAEVYRYISEQTTQANVAIQANYNLATSLIAYAQLLEAQLILLAEESNIDELINFDIDDEQFLDPQPYFQEATSILRLLLSYAPQHKASAQNLEWLTVRADNINKANQQQQSQQQQNSEQKQQQDQDSKEQDSDKKSEQQNSEKQSAQNDKPQEQEQQENQQDSLDMNSLTLPPPSASAEEIMQQAKKRDQQDRSQQRKKQNSVERDW